MNFFFYVYLSFCMKSVFLKHLFRRFRWINRTVDTYRYLHIVWKVEKNNSHLKNIAWNQFTAHTYSRNFDKEILRVNCRNFHTVLHDTIRYQIFASLVQIAYIAPLYDIIHWIPFLRLFYAFFFFFEESLNLREPVQWNITLFSNNTLDTLACSKMVFTYFQIAMLF